jgi:hypothetical protein
MPAPSQDRLVRDAASAFLGREITNEEWSWAMPRAKYKLRWIIARDGDDEVKHQPRYLGKLIEEAIRADELTRRTMQQRYIAIQRDGNKKDRPSMGRKQQPYKHYSYPTCDLSIHQKPNKEGRQ